MKDLLTSTLMYRLSRHRWQSRKMKRGLHKGGRRSNKQGTSQEFSDYRFYQPGDDLRQIDWNVYARTNKHYIKRFLDEQELIMTIYLDCSNSMTIVPEKWNIARGLAASIGYMALSSDDRVGVFPVGAKDYPFTYKKGRAFANRLVHYIEGVASDENQISFSDSVLSMIQSKSGVTIVISDLLEPLEEIEGTLKKLQAQKQELYVVQVLSLAELDPFYHGDLQLVDSETMEFMNVTMSAAVKKQYKQRLSYQQEYIEKFCNQRGIGFVVCQANDSLEDIMFKTLTSKGWIQ